MAHILHGLSADKPRMCNLCASNTQFAACMLIGMNIASRMLLARVLHPCKGHANTRSARVGEDWHAICMGMILASPTNEVVSLLAWILHLCNLCAMWIGMDLASCVCGILLATRTCARWLAWILHGHDSCIVRVGINLA